MLKNHLNRWKRPGDRKKLGKEREDLRWIITISASVWSCRSDGGTETSTNTHFVGPIACWRSSGRRMMIEYNGPTSIPDYWISLTGSSRPPRRINTPRHHGRALLKSPHRFGARCGNFGRRRPDPGFVFRTFPSTEPRPHHMPEKKPGPSTQGPAEPVKQVKSKMKRADREGCPRPT